jgi:hypothetical protein
MHPADLEKLVGEELQALPAPRAPLTLLPRVMAAVQELARKPWYARAWFTWPLGWQVVTVAMLVVLTAGAGALLIGAEAAIGETLWRFTGPPLANVAGSARHVVRAIEVADVLFRTFVAPVLPYIFALVVLMCLACAAFGTLLNHVVVGRMSEQ